MSHKRHKKHKTDRGCEEEPVENKSKLDEGRGQELVKEFLVPFVPLCG